MSIKKKTLKSKPVCKATFKLGKESANGAKKAFVVGDFNEWNPKADEMKALKDGGFTTTIDLESNKEYAFRYLLDGKNWVNDDKADKYVSSEFGDSKNCIIEA
ncbi:MAG: 1,4-alpha-glucan branching enzyme [Arenicella sp.]|jgi:1,4-alpha-glucan branching enzyme